MTDATAKFLDAMMFAGMHSSRTRYLPLLDAMISQDRDGAVMDMMQVLRERGAIGKIDVHTTVRTVMLDKAEGFRTACQRDLIRHLAATIQERDLVAFSERPSVEPGMTVISAVIETVKRERP